MSITFRIDTQHTEAKKSLAPICTPNLNLSLSGPFLRLDKSPNPDRIFKSKLTPA